MDKEKEAELVEMLGKLNEPKPSGTGLNLPELPEGYYFRVRSNFFGIYPFVYLMKTRKFLWDKEIDKGWQSSTAFSSNKVEIEWLAGILAERFYRRRRIYEDEYIEGDFK